MTSETIKNKHLREKIDLVNGFVSSGEEPPENLIVRLINELKVSNLLISALEDGDEYTFEHVSSEEDGTAYLPLFTSIEEYDKHITEDDDEFSPMDFEFDVYVELVSEGNFDGIIIDMEGDFIILDNDFLSAAAYEIEVPEFEGIEPFTAEELKEIFETVSNDELLDLMAENPPIDRLYAELSECLMLDLVISDTSADGFAKDGIINVDDVGGFALCSIDTGEGFYAAVFTDKNAIENVIPDDSDMFYYGQVTVLGDLFDYALRNDLDGILINPNSDDYVILRDDFLSQAGGIEVILNNPKLDNALEYAFLL